MFSLSARSGLRASARQHVRISPIGICLLSYVVLFVLGSLGFFEEFGGVWAAEQVDSPVGEYMCPVEVVAQLVQVNPLPDERPEQTTQLYPQDVDEGATLPEIHQLAYGAVTEG